MPSARMKALLLLAGLLVATGVVVAFAASHAPERASAPSAPHGMQQDERCAHMPEHCEPAGGAASG